MSAAVDHQTTTTLTIRKQRVAVEQRMALKALLMEMFPEAFTGQIIVHFNARNPVIAEWQEREEFPSNQRKGVSFL